MTRRIRCDLAGTCLTVEVGSGLPASLGPQRLELELAAELACFPPWRKPPGQGITIRLRGRRTRGEPGPGAGHLVARVTPEVTVELEPRNRRATLFLAGRPRLQEVVLAAWAQAATLARLAGAPAGRRRTSFHAASLARAGAGLLVLGESGAGKTTFSLLLAHGLVAGIEPLGYLGDEDALVELAGREIRLLPLPRRIRVLGPRAKAHRLRGTRGRAFGETALVVARKPGEERPAPARLAAVVELSPRAPDPRRAPGAVSLEPLEHDRLAFALLAGLERFPTEATPDASVQELFREANRDGFAIALELARRIPGYRLVYSQPDGFEAAARALAGLLEQGPGIKAPRRQPPPRGSRAG